MSTLLPFALSVPSSFTLMAATRPLWMLIQSSFMMMREFLRRSVMLLLPKFVAGFSGDYVDAFGYAQFFTSTALLGLPVLVLVWLASRIQKVGGA